MTPGPAPREPRVAAVVTWFHPPADAPSRIEGLRQQCDTVIVVDNTPGGAQALAEQLDRSVVYLAQDTNRGLAAALNTAMEAVPESASQVLFLDQDSSLPPGAVHVLARHLLVKDVAVAAPVPFDQERARPIDPRRPHSGVRDMDAVITSGMLARRDALRQVGRFREDFFVDGVDQDMCLRLRRAGWRIVQDSSVLLPHELGELRWRRVLGLTFRCTNHPEWRLHDAARNGVILLREQALVAPRWAALQLLQLLYWFLTIVLFEAPRRSRARAFVTGVVAGARGRPLRMPIA